MILYLTINYRRLDQNKTQKTVGGGGKDDVHDIIITMAMIYIEARIFSTPTQPPVQFGLCARPLSLAPNDRVSE